MINTFVFTVAALHHSMLATRNLFATLMPARALPLMPLKGG
jgi:hypothetical protein